MPDVSCQLTGNQIQFFLDIHNTDIVASSSGFFYIHISSAADAASQTGKTGVQLYPGSRTLFSAVPRVRRASSASSSSAKSRAITRSS